MHVGLGLGLTRGQGGGVFSPHHLYQSGDILLWYDPSDLSTMFTNTTGTTQVSADGDSVALMLDKGQWGGKTLEQVLAAQPEMVTNGGFDSDITGWSASSAGGNISWSSGKILVERVSAGVTAYAAVACTIGNYYRVTYTFNSVVSASPRVGVTNSTGAIGSGETTPGTHTFMFVATATTMYIHLGLNSGNGTSATYDNISVKLIPGYHRTQATGTSMPKYKTGPNPVAAANSPELVTNGGFDSGTAGWTAQNSSIGEVGGELVVTGSGGVFPKAQQTISGLTAGRTYLMEATARKGTTASNVYISPVVGTDVIASSTSATRLQAIFVASGATATIVVGIASGTGSGTAIFDDISFKEIPASAPYIHWLLYDGTDDSHATGTITWGTDEVAACVGLYKASDAAQACFAAFGTNGGVAGVNAEQGLILAPGAAAATTYYARFTGSMTPTQAVATGYAAPHAGVVSVRGKIATDLQGISVNQGTEALGSGDMGTGNFNPAMPLHFGRRASTSIPFNGREYQTVIRSRLLSAAELSSLETFIAAKTGVIL